MKDRTRSSLLLVWIVSNLSRLHILLQLKTQSSLQLELRPLRTAATNTKLLSHTCKGRLQEKHLSSNVVIVSIVLWIMQLC